MFDTLPAQIGAGVAVAICLFAFLKGDEPERMGAGAFMLGYFASLLAQADTDLRGFQPAIFAIDLVMLAIYAGLAWKSKRTWPIWVCALQLLAIMSHVMVMVDLRTPIRAFYIVVNLSSYGILLAIGLGAFWAWQDRRAAGLE